MAEQQPKLRPMESTAYSDSERLIRAIGQLQVRMGGEWPSPSYESDELNELWVRNRVVLLRKLIEHHPSHEAALSCAVQLEGHESEQPWLFSRVNDGLNAQEFQITGLYEAPDWSNDEYLRRWREELGPLEDIQEERAESLIETYPKLRVAEWAHRFRIEKFANDMIRSRNEGSGVGEKSISTLLSMIEDFVELRRDCTTAIEPVYDYWFAAGMRQCAGHLVLAIDCLEPRDRRIQVRLLQRVSNLLPNQKQLANYARRLHSEGKKFTLFFNDLVSGEHVDIRNYQGQVVLINFLSTGCVHCTDFVHGLRAFVGSHHGSVAVISIFSDRAANNQLVERKVCEYLEKHRISWSVSLDHRLLRHWSIRTIPTLFAIDRQGILRSTHAEEDFPQVVEELLSEP
ncbi:MAG: TlpA disulfide reductase family protein [Gammaproteobacteria bacterium]|nr:TlpA disulfide reductase family protein [Gammaproteobacteria bacterium]